VPVLEAGDKGGAFARDALPAITAQVNHCDAIVCGCGLTVSPETAGFVASVIDHAASHDLPLLLDADALNVLSLQVDDFALKGATAVLTPHAGELQRLLTTYGLDNVQQLAGTLGAIVVAKGPRTTITDGALTQTLGPATPGLATAGTGDVLSGVIGALLAQGLPAFAAARTGVELHGLAGRLAAQQVGEYGMIATDVIAQLPAASRINQ
jgi:NAD(P)H-hydrate epimerase